MFLTHYVRQRPKKSHEWDTGAKLSSTESLLYDLAPRDVLFTQGSLVEVYLQELNMKPTEYRGFPKKSAELFDVINSLVSKEYFKEINGVRLARWLDTF